MSSRYRLFAAIVACALALLFSSPGLRAQTWQWLREGSGSGDDIIGGAAMDSLGNVYVVGTYQLNVAFGASILTNNNTRGLFLVKYSPLGVQQWLIGATGPGNVLSSAIAVSRGGEVYLTGTFNGEVRFDTDTLKTTGGTDIFMARFNAGGIRRWARRSGIGIGDIRASGIAVDNTTQECYVGGHFADTARFDTTTLQSVGGTDMFVLKFNSAGVVRWASSAGGSGSEEVAGVGIDGGANSYLAGRFQDSTIVGTDTVVSVGGTDAFVAKFNNLGAPTWVSTGGGSGDDGWNGIAMDSFGNSFVTGAFADTAAFDTTVLQSRGGSDVVIAKLDGVGAVRWAHRYGSGMNDEGFGITLDSLGDVYATGYVKDTSDFGNVVLPISANNADVFATKLDGAGVFGWVRSAGGAGRDEGHAIVVDRNLEMRVVGMFTDPASFGSLTARGIGNLDVFTAKLGDDPQIRLGALLESSYCVGDEFQIPFTTKGIFGVGNYFIAQLSDSTGDFSNPVEIGRVFGIGGTTVLAKIPTNTLPGTLYRLRVVSTVPDVRSPPNPIPFPIFGTPTPEITPAGPVSICPGDSVVLDAGPGFTTYVWNSGDIGRRIVVKANGEYQVTVSNTRGCTGTSQRVIVTVLRPVKPVITRSGQTLESTPATSYQWFYNGAPVAGSVDRTLSPTQEGQYVVQVIDSNGCRATSDPFNYTFAAVPVERRLAGVKLFPQPTSGLFTVNVPSVHAGIVTIIVSDALGRRVALMSVAAAGGEFAHTVDLDGHASGVYFVRVESDGREWSGRVVKQ